MTTPKEVSVVSIGRISFRADMIAEYVSCRIPLSAVFAVYQFFLRNIVFIRCRIRSIPSRTDVIAEYIPGLIPLTAVLTIGHVIRRILIGLVSISGVPGRTDMVAEYISFFIPISAEITVYKVGSRRAARTG